MNFFDTADINLNCGRSGEILGEPLSAWHAGLNEYHEADAFYRHNAHTRVE